MAHMLCPAPGMKLCVSGMQQLVPCWGGWKDTPTQSCPWPSLLMVQTHRTVMCAPGHHLSSFPAPWTKAGGWFCITPSTVVSSGIHLSFDSLSSFLPASFSSPLVGMLTWIPSPLLSAQTGPNAITPSQPTDLNSLLFASLDMLLWLSSCGTMYDHCSHSSNHNTYCYHSFPGQLFCVTFSPSALSLSIGNQLVLTVIFFYPLFTSATDRSHSSLCINFVPSLSHTCLLSKSPSTHDAPFGYPSDSLPFP
ncbi:hypothetical protein B0H14DRAFT_3046333 [Mycena olivaceomarginata]|nr:hypothetical protein B0H14DRAFT_3046333 [Mycena olivaceomarginata]